jgi:transposase-like protein
MTKASSNRFSPEVRQRAVRMVLDHASDHASQWAAIGSIAAKIGCTAETLRKWVRQAERDQGLRAGCEPGRRRRNASGSRRWNGRTGNCAKRTRSCAKRQRISLRRSSTAARSHDRLYRRSPGRRRGRADLHGAADRPVHLSCSCRAACRSHQGLGASASGCGVAGSDTPCVRGELRRLRCAQDLASARSGGNRCRPMHGGTADAADGPARRHPRQGGQDHGC